MFPPKRVSWEDSLSLQYFQGDLWQWCDPLQACNQHSSWGKEVHWLVPGPMALQGSGSLFLGPSAQRRLIWPSGAPPPVKTDSCGIVRDSQVAIAVKKPAVNAEYTRDRGSIPGREKSPGGGPGNPLQYSCLENPHGQWSLVAMVHKFAKNRTQLKWLSTHGHRVF